MRDDGERVARDAASDIYYGQVVIIWARWFVILAGGLLSLWMAATIADLMTSMLLVAAMMALNFYLHGRYLLGRPANRALVLTLSVLDLTIITGIVAAWHGQAGLRSPFFVCYYPLLLAVAFVLPPRLSLGYTGLALLAYSAASLLIDPLLVVTTLDAKVLAARLVTLAAMGGLGAFYWRSLRDRQRAAGSRSPQLSGLPLPPRPSDAI